MMRIIICFIFLFFSLSLQARPLNSNEKASLVKSGSWNQHCQIQLKDLRLLTVPYYNYQHQSRQGEVIVNKIISDKTKRIFQKLYKLKFSIHRLVAVWSKKDKKNLYRHNVSFGFRCGNQGLAVTLNPAVNPKVIRGLQTQSLNSVQIQPAQSALALNRRMHVKGMNEAVAAIFKKQGFVWGGDSLKQINSAEFIYNKIQHAMAPLNGGKKSAYFLKNSLRRVGQQNQFNIEPMSQQEKRDFVASDRWHVGCPVPLDRLSKINIAYYDFHNKIQHGHLFVFDAAAPFILKAFQSLYEEHYPLEKVGNMDAKTYAQTLAFDCRDMRGMNKYSLHAMGLAIDINVTRNPYIGEMKIQQKEGVAKLKVIPEKPTSYLYLNRHVKRPGMNEAIIKIMAKAGFIVWGGDWHDSLDYMHFQVPDNFALQIIYLDKQSAEEMLRLAIHYPVAAKRLSANTEWKQLYLLYPKKYTKVFSRYFSLLAQQPENQVFKEVYTGLVGS